ncbi:MULTISPECIES: hypothetical protein [unclassified Nocardioides]|jgi:hypothetical protein|uniref:hypothetical protein n=1 Tax=unclassified Nocardioides TaxID=2615069 RepID=UPI001150975D|nr:MULTISPECIES: hypothetical protein [unclassified Nocardioides]TQK73209.1 hypothetical protein FBY23_5035 [Nocardioides sp. SLBN-35]WGY02554.1 hypothetical protein QI633_02080 [Nocardioides sp. QY071]
MKIKLVSSAVLLAVTLSACGGGGRPSQDEVADAIKDQIPGGSSALTDDVIDCIAKAVVDSDLSDETLNKMVDNDKGSSDEVSDASEVIGKASADCIAK